MSEGMGRQGGWNGRVCACTTLQLSWVWPGQLWGPRPPQPPCWGARGGGGQRRVRKSRFCSLALPGAASVKGDGFSSVTTPSLSSWEPFSDLLTAT